MKIAIVGGTGSFGLALAQRVAAAGYDVVIRFTDVFVRRDGSWQAVASHASLLQG